MGRTSNVWEKQRNLVRGWREEYRYCFDYGDP
jgi:hypothetical protein